MDLSTLRRAVIAAAVGHIGGITLLLLAGALALKGDDPDRMLAPIAVGGLLIGALICGLLARALSSGMEIALFSAGSYLIPALIPALMGGFAVTPLPIKLGALVGCAGLILTPSAIGRAARRGRRSSIRKSVGRSGYR